MKKQNNKRNEVSSTKRKQKPVTLYLDDVYMEELNRVSEKRLKRGMVGGYSAILRELVIIGIQKGLIND